eukprot:CAMPEP_0197025524 /NCGR_PEP_ID=MMETSP1384-20130603/5829_1 /TAXON_ID=29189 /ORGANISM="Ammonia sp." /LENGTH=563 /DNA_ID=CAMNT_0042454061 /DNA_START=37 /DNA_END=1725 /DNA_ORIENTATION=+
MLALKGLADGAKKLKQDLVNEAKKRLGGDEFDEKRDQTQWAHCVIKPYPDPPKDGDTFMIREADTLVIRDTALDVISTNFSNIVSLVGPPGAGKSTLSTAIYNAQRGDRRDYFEVSGKSIESFTRGIWSLNERTKVSQSAKDRVDLLDLEGIADEDVIHYLVVIAMTLSKAILVCANLRNGNCRIDFPIFKTLAGGVRIFKQHNIKLKPVIYIQVPFGETLFTVSDNMKIDEHELFAAIKRKYKVLQDFEMRTFSVPSFKNNRFDRHYMQSVQSLIKELQGIEELKSAKTENRVEYARNVANALITNSPSMVNDFNFKILREQIKLITAVHESNAKLTLCHKAESKLPLKEMISYTKFCRSVCPSGTFGYAEGIKEEAKALAYYDPDDKRHEQAIEEIDDAKFCIEAQQAIDIRNVYEKGIIELEQLLMTKGKQFMDLDAPYFQSFVHALIQTYINKIDFYGSTSLPYELQAAVDAKRHELKTKLLENTQHVVKIPAHYLSDKILTTGWKTATNKLKEAWETRKRRAIGDRKVIASGNLVCPKCGNDHTPGVGHKQCGKGALW